MRQQLRLRVLLPVAVLGLLGAGVGAFAMGQPAEPASVPLATTAATAPTTTGGETVPAPTPKKKQKAESAKSALQRQLADHGAVVVVFHTPGANVDAAAIREARAGAAEVGAGFLAVNVTKEGSVAVLAKEYTVLEAPTVLVLTRGPEMRARFDGYVDRETVAQAVANARK